jgi:hypothetical protein
MRKPRDYDAELKALDDKAKLLRSCKVQQLGEMVVACGADALSPEHLAGALLGIGEVKDANLKERWRERGAAFFQRSPRRAASNAGDKSGGTLPL